MQTPTQAETELQTLKPKPRTIRRKASKTLLKLERNTRNALANTHTHKPRNEAFKIPGAPDGSVLRPAAMSLLWGLGVSVGRLRFGPHTRRIQATKFGVPSVGA